MLDQTRQGKIDIGLHDINQHPENISALFTAMQFVPIHIDLDILGAKFRYTGISPEFRELAKGELIPVCNLCYGVSGGEITSLSLMEVEHE